MGRLEEGKRRRTLGRSRERKRRRKGFFYIPGQANAGSKEINSFQTGV